MARILLIEDDDGLARSIVLGLRDEDYVVDRAADGEEGLWQAASGLHDALILDLRLPGLPGLELCRRLRAGGSELPVLMLTASDTPAEVVVGLDSGADDYLTKPFDFEVLLARLRALLRRGSTGGGAVLRTADLELDCARRRARRGGLEIELSAMEYRLLEHLVRHAGRVQSRSALAAALWDDPIGPDSNVLEVLISKLRRKIDDGRERPLIRTRRGEGYLLDGSAT